MYCNISFKQVAVTYTNLQHSSWLSCPASSRRLCLSKSLLGGQKTNTLHLLHIPLKYLCSPLCAPPAFMTARLAQRDCSSPAWSKAICVQLWAVRSGRTHPWPCPNGAHSSWWCWEFLWWCCLVWIFSKNIIESKKQLHPDIFYITLASGRPRLHLVDFAVQSTTPDERVRVPFSVHQHYYSTSWEIDWSIELCFLFESSLVYRSICFTGSDLPRCLQRRWSD